MKLRLPLILALSVSVLALPREGRAQTEIKPYILLLFDTSGSMAYDVCGSSLGSDGSVECTGTDRSCSSCNTFGCGNGVADDTRMWKVKNGMSAVVSAYGEVVFGLARFSQQRRNFACTGGGWLGADTGYYSSCRIKCTTNAECGPTGVCNSSRCRICADSSGNPTSTCQSCTNNNQCPGPTDCISGACRMTADAPLGQGDNQADILVPFAANNAETILSWMNNRSDYPSPGNSGAPPDGATCTIPSCPDCGTGCDWELRAEGNTPLAGSLYDVRTTFFNGASGVIANDPKAACRPYKVILLTDGQDNCLGDPVTEAGNLFNNAGKSIPVHVVGFASSSLKPYLDQIAAAGGTNQAVIVDNEVSLALAIANIISESVLRETCNGADDNCNGACDENWPEVGAPAGCTNAGAAQSCTVGLGICQRTGQYVCKSDGSGSQCNVTPGAPNPGGEICDNGLDDDCDGAIDEGCSGCIPQAEICNGKDDNCNGLVDEGYVSVPCGSDIGECKKGTTACIAGKVVCQGATPPTTELCDNKDNNCDTVVDGFTSACYASSSGTSYTSGCNVGTGVCVGACQLGLSLCTAGTQGACMGAIGPVPEICNGKDDNCDGQIDEGVKNTCTNYTVGATHCQTYQTCAACPFKPTEICNNVDDDCNGTVDDIAGVPCGSSVGECKKGTTACSGGVEICSGGTGPSTETCDGKDNDCNGKIDDNVPGMGVPCGNNVGECKQGTLQCVAGKVECVGGVGPQPEICDGKDNDCDGTADNNIAGTACGSNVGECKAGTTVCQAGALICQGSVGPQPELCDGKDNDCNGVADDNPTDVGQSCGLAVGECVPGQTQCVNGAKVCVGEIGPKPEVCDGLDNDCNGTADDGVAGTGATCGTDVGECKKGTMACQSTPSGWALVCTGSVGPQPEICDGKDNNCDGQTDEDYPEKGQACGTNVGECQAGAWKCDAGALICEGGVGPTTESCDGKDNDCNGAIDDNVPGDGQPCGNSVGECTPGATKCIGGKFECVGGTQPGQEICDGKDNDCDGVADQNAACPGSSTCIEGQCVVPCGTGEFNCPGGSRCVNGYCIPDACSKVTCKDTERCTDGKCVEKCAGRTCKDTERCEPTTGQCVDDTCLSKGCPGTQVCVNYKCVDNPCGGVECTADQMCVDGKCVETCANVTCKAGETCEQGVCKADPCSTIPPAPRISSATSSTASRAARATPAPSFTVRRVRSVARAPASTIPARPRPAPSICSVRSTRTVRPTACPSRAPTCPRPRRCSPPAAVASAAPSAPTPPRPTGERRRAACSCSWASRCSAGCAAVTRRTNDDPPSHALVELRSSWEKMMHRVVFKVGLLVGILTLASACTQDPYVVSTKGSLGDAALNDGLPKDGSIYDGASDGLDAKVKGDVDACVPSNEGKEICDGLDNDCNGKVDDVDPIFLKTDNDHCGECNKPCVIVNAFAKCVDGKCQLDTCAPGYHDTNKDLKDGCEYQCLESNGGVEICDEADNNCDGTIDEGFDKQTDVNNCGKCGNRCIFSNGTGACQGGKCVLTGCAAGFADNNKSDVDGCEYKCPVWPTKTEECSGKDDDCDGLIDEGLPGTGQACDTGKLGVCKDGQTQCQGGKIECVAQNTPSQEICDGKDNDCNGTVDDGFDLNTNVLHCGQCNKQCSFPNAIPKCENKVCKIDRCLNGYADLDPNQPGCEHKCEVFPTTAEKCNGKDDNCDGVKDEGFDLNTDVNNCGTCGKVCSFPHAQASCVNKVCTMVPNSCDADYYDIDPNQPGCEYYCLKTNNGVEICDGADNNCDGVKDEGFNLQTDVNNCGSCGNVCQFNNAAASCVAGKCVMGACNTGYKDLDPNTPGCEYKCPVWPPTANELSAATRCDGVDNDCDGSTDEDVYPPSASNPRPSSPAIACGTSVGECSAGTLYCGGGIESCVGATLPSVEICDGKDNNCDGTADEGFDKLNDPRYCNNCAGCNIPHAIPKCTNGVCGIAVCEQGWTDDPNKPGPDCDYNCTPTGPEICDGIDNDCNGTPDDGLTAPVGACVTTGACASPAPTISCQGTYGWVCAYNSKVEKRTCTTNADCINVPCNTTTGICPGELPDEETLCDNEDNNCNGLIDEPFTNKGTACAEAGKQGICQGTGTYQCESVLKKSTVCVITTPGQAPKNEECNGKDDDCDGKIDEATNDGGFLGVVDATRRITRGGLDYYIYTYEASHPAATSTVAGNLTHRACSKANVLPWTNITRSDAEQACKGILPGCVMPAGFDCQTGADCCSGTCTNNVCTAGSCAGKTQCWRLCTATEWQYACEGSTPQTYPYGNAYQATYCNAKDNDGDPVTAGDQDVLLPTGNKTQCVSADGAYDMSGNAREWTADPRGDGTPPDPDGYTVRGGGFDTPAGGSTCQFTSAIFPNNFTYPNLGFRCCRGAN